MYKHILVPTDGSELSELAVSQATQLAGALNAELLFVSVTAPFHSVSGTPEMVVNMPAEYKSFVEDYISAESVGHLAQARAVAEAAKVPCDTASVEHEHVYEAIIETAEKRGCDLIVMASHGRRGLSGVVLGSETHKVLTHSKIPVLVCR